MFMKTSNIRSVRGFTLVEVMLVAAIVGILAAISIPTYFKMRGIARRVEAKVALGALYSAERSFYAEWSQYFTAFEAIGYQPEGNLRYLNGFKNANSPPAAMAAPPVASKDTQDYCVTNQASESSICMNDWGTTATFSSSVNSGASATGFTAEAVSTNLHYFTSPDDWSMDQDGMLVENSSGL